MALEMDLRVKEEDAGGEVCIEGYIPRQRRVLLQRRYERRGV